MLHLEVQLADLPGRRVPDPPQQLGPGRHDQMPQAGRRHHMQTGTVRRELVVPQALGAHPGGKLLAERLDPRPRAEEQHHSALGHTPQIPARLGTVQLRPERALHHHPPLPAVLPDDPGYPLGGLPALRPVPDPLTISGRHGRQRPQHLPHGGVFTREVRKPPGRHLLPARDELVDEVHEQAFGH